MAGEFNEQAQQGGEFSAEDQKAAFAAELTEQLPESSNEQSVRQEAEAALAEAQQRLEQAEANLDHIQKARIAATAADGSVAKLVSDQQRAEDEYDAASRSMREIERSIKDMDAYDRDRQLEEQDQAA